MNIRRLTPADAPVFQTFRLAALKDEPQAFGSSFEEEKDFSISVVESRLATRIDRGAIGAFLDDALVGVVALGREDKVKLAHKGMIWGLYVEPQARGRGLGRALLRHAISLARSVDGLRKLNLSVNGGNASAIRLYETEGFKVFGREPEGMLIDGVLHEEVHMCLMLANG
ncbi:MAG: N-acetyltransferase family protein [Burkholderiales bacterium]